MRALLIGREPAAALGWSYVTEPPYDAVVIGSLSLGSLLRFREEAVLEALAQGKSVYLYTPGLPESPKNRALAASLTAAQRELKNWGVLFTDGGRKRLITAEEARLLLAQGKRPGQDAVLTPLAKESIENRICCRLHLGHAEGRLPARADLSGGPVRSGRAGGSGPGRGRPRGPGAACHGNRGLPVLHGCPGGRRRGGDFRQ